MALIFSPSAIPAQDLSRDIRQQGIGEDIVHVTRAALDFSTAAGHFVEEGVVIGQLDLVILQNAALDLAQLQANDLLQSFVADRVVRDETMRPRKAGLKILLRSGLSASTRARGLGAVSGSATSFIN